MFFDDDYVAFHNHCIFRSKLNELVDNNKNQITSLTLLADDYSEHAEQLTDAICKHIYEVGKIFLILDDS